MTKPASAAASLAAPCPSLFSDSGSLAQDLVEAYLAVRNETERRAAPLSPEDQLIQSMPDASPAKWHRAHTTWFFEQFLLGEHCRGYQPFHPDYAYLFNSYYVSAGPRHARHQRGHLTRPGADEITAYRRHVDAAVVKFFREADEDTLAGIVPLVEVGLNHEQQHQELMLTDILHAFAQNPIPPAYDPQWQFPASTPRRRRMGQPQRGHPYRRACRRQLSFRQRKTRAPRAGRPGQAQAQSRHQCRMARLHEGRRLRHADALADGRFCGRQQRRLAGARPLAGD